MKTRIIVLSSLLAAGVIVGCGSSGPGTFSSGLDGSAEAQDLTTDELVEFCEALGTYAEDSADAEISCKASGFGEEGDACQEEIDACIEEAAEADGDAGLDCSVIETLPEGILDGCEATVAEMEACITDVAQDGHDTMDEWACGDDIPEFSTPTSCETVCDGGATCGTAIGFLVPGLNCDDSGGGDPNGGMGGESGQ